jgi:hypothetical protein
MQKNNLYLVFILLVLTLKLSAQVVIVDRKTACVDDVLTFQKGQFGCFALDYSLKPTNNCAIKRLPDGSLQLQMTQVGTVSVACTCGTGSSIPTIEITVKDCESSICLDENLVPNPSFERYANCVTPYQALSLSLSGTVYDWEDYPKNTDNVTFSLEGAEFGHLDCPFVRIIDSSLIFKNKPRTGKGLIGAYLMEPTLPVTNEKHRW